MVVKRWELWITKLNTLLSQPLGMLIGIMMMLFFVVLFFVVKGNESQRRAIDIANDTRSTVENTQVIIKTQQNIIIGQSETLCVLRQHTEENDHPIPEKEQRACREEAERLHREFDMNIKEESQ